jgi:hypothetical protein
MANSLKASSIKDCGGPFRASAVSVLVGFAFCATSVNAMPVVTSTAGGARTFPGEDTAHGWTFLANSSITVTELGLYDESGNGLDQSHEIGLFRLSDGALLTSGTLSTGKTNPLVGEFRYVDTPDVTLSAGNTYAMAYYTASYTWMDSDEVANSANVDPVISLLDGRWQGDTGGLVLPTNTGEVNFGPNFMYAVPVPEPETYVMLLAGLGLMGFVGRRRKQKAGSLSQPQ